MQVMQDAAYNGYVAEVRRCLAAGVDVNCTGEVGVLMTWECMYVVKSELQRCLAAGVIINCKAATRSRSVQWWLVSCQATSKPRHGCSPADVHYRPTCCVRLEACTLALTQPPPLREFGVERGIMQTGGSIAAVHYCCGGMACGGRTFLLNAHPRMLLHAPPWRRPSNAASI
jgi:hypothetical protein